MSSNGFLHRYFLNNSHKLLHKWLHYFDIYERHLARFRNSQSVMLEVGVSGGGSLAMWKEYLGPGSQIIGLDIDPSCKIHEGGGIEIFIGSQDDETLISQIKEKYPRIDIVLDDGSHIMRHMIATFRMLYDHVHPYGIYIVEDTHTCYLDGFEGGLRREGSFMEFAKDKLDEINAVYTSGEVPVTAFTRSTDAVCFYDSVVVFERRPQGARQSIRTWPM